MNKLSPFVYYSHDRFFSKYGCFFLGMVSDAKRAKNI